MVSHWDADIDHHLWTQWWTGRALSGPETLFRSDVLSYPQIASLQLADLNLAVAVPAALLTSALGLAGAYNVLLLLSLLLSGGLAARLVERLGVGAGAAWLAGGVYAASPAWLCSVLNGWGYLVHGWVLPLCALAFVRVRERPTPRRWAELGLALALAFHVTPYYALHAAVLLAALGLADAPRVARALRGVGAWRSGLALALPLALLVLPRALPMWAAGTEPLAAHHGAQNTSLAAPLLELLWPDRAAVEARAPRLGYLVVFLGWVAPLVIAAGLALGGRRRLYARWAFAAAVTLTLALGPALRLSDAAAPGLPLPARWLQQLPGFSLTTNHWRWVLPAGLCLAAMLGLALEDLAGCARRRRLPGRRGLLPAVGAAFALELAFAVPLPLAKPLWPTRPSPVAALVRDASGIRGVIDRTHHPKLNQSVHGRPLALAWRPRMPRSERSAQARLAVECRDLDAACLARHGIDAVILDDRRALRIERTAGGVVARELRADREP